MSNIKLYTRTVCPKCVLVKSVLESREIEYEVLNTDENKEAREEIIAQGFMSAPILKVGDTYYNGIPEIQKVIGEI